MVCRETGSDGEWPSLCGDAGLAQVVTPDRGSGLGRMSPNVLTKDSADADFGRSLLYVVLFCLSSSPTLAVVYSAALRCTHPHLPRCRPSVVASATTISLLTGREMSSEHFAHEEPHTCRYGTFYRRLLSSYLQLSPFSTASLQALEVRVTELEEENNCLRAALNLPPANRPPLGKGPTGKDKPKTLDNPSLSQPNSKSRDSSPIGESPSPQRSESTSPPLMGASMRTPPIMQNNQWDEGGFIMNDQQSTPHPSHLSSTPSSVAYNLRPLPPTSDPQKSPHQFTFANPTSRPVIASSVPSNSMSSSYQHTTDRPMASGYNDMNYLLCDVRDNTHPHYSYHYQPSPFSGESSLPTQSPQVPVHSQTSPTAPRPSLPPAISFQPRRSHHDPPSFRPLVSDLHLPSPTPHHSARLTSPSSPALHDVRSHYTSHGK